MNNLRILLMKAGMSQADLARKTNISAATISRWLSGQDYPSAKRLSAIASALNVSITELLGETASLEGKVNSMVKEQLFKYKSGLEVLPPDHIPAYVCEPRNLPYYEVPSRGKENFLVERMEGYMEVNWTRKGDLIVVVKGSSVQDLEMPNGTCVAVKKYSPGQEIEKGKIVLASMKHDGEYLTALVKYDKRIDKKDIIGIAVDSFLHKKL